VYVYLYSESATELIGVSHSGGCTYVEEELKLERKVRLFLEGDGGRGEIK
jgi:hypothetical protein